VIVSARVHQDRITLDTKDPLSVSASLAHIAAPLVAAMAAPFRTVRATTEPIRDKVLWGEALQGLREVAAVGAAALRGAVSKRGDVPARPDEGDMLSGPPALGRSVTDADDPHKGRFGGEASRSGFTLSARFAGGEEANPVEITLAVLCEKDLESYDDVVEFFLHPTFRPSRLRVAFRGQRAVVQIVSRGGFTVGAWSPKRQVELELDFARLPDAPRIVREL
jgi:hypothetical protein